MASWHQRARVGVAIMGLAVAAIVYFAMKERPAPPARPPVTRTDPKAILEARGSDFERTAPESVTRLVELKGVDKILVYDDGSTRLIGINYLTFKRGEREFVASGREGRVSRDSKDYEIFGDVKLRASDGFELQTDRATYREEDGIARTPSAVTFSKGRMSGSGTGVSWDQNTDVLTIHKAPIIVTRDETGKTTTELRASSAALDRLKDQAALRDGAHVVRGSQVIDARNAVANLSPEEDVVRFIALTGDARVTGAGSSIDAMNAQDIDLDYTDDGATLERVVLRGNGAIAMTGQNGAPGRQMRSEMLDLTLAADGSLLRATGQGMAQLDLPPGDGTPARNIRSATLDASGQAGRGLTGATFTGDVSFTEAAIKGGAQRNAASQELRVTLADDVVTSATFSGRASFEEEGLLAGAARMDYQPGKGTLLLTGMAGNPLPCVANEDVTIDAQTIDVTLQGQNFQAKGNVKTVLHGDAQSEAACGGRKLKKGSAGASKSSSRLPGLLDQKSSATVTAEALDYQGSSGKAVYTGRSARPTLIQGTTVVKGDTITIDQKNGDLTASGNASSDITFEGEYASGRADEIRYIDTKRIITYTMVAVAVATPGAPTTARLSGPLLGPRGELWARSIDVVLAADESRVDRVEARQDVAIRTSTDSVRSADRLTYDAAKGLYKIDAPPQRPLIWFNKQGTQCREGTGTQMTFSKSGSDAALDGLDQRLSQTLPKPCPANLP